MPNNFDNKDKNQQQQSGTKLDKDVNIKAGQKRDDEKNVQNKGQNQSDTTGGM